MPVYVLPAKASWNTVSNTPSVVAQEHSVCVWVGHEWPETVCIAMVDADIDTDQIWGDPNLAIKPWKDSLLLPVGKAIYCVAEDDFSLVFNCEEVCQVLDVGGGLNVVYRHDE